MAKKVIISKRAQWDRKEILRYWKKRNKSKKYSIKLSRLFRETFEHIRINPELGVFTFGVKFRSRFIRDYQIIYRQSGDEIYILTIWDCRQNPSKLKQILKN